MKNSSGKWKKPFALALDVFLVLLAVFSGKITELMANNLEGCWLYTRFGMKCLVCGGTRCVNALSRGEIAEAFGYNSFVIIFGVILFFVLILLNVAWVFRSEKAEYVLKKLCNVKVAVICAISASLYVIVRNFYPLLYLIK